MRLPGGMQPERLPERCHAELLQGNLELATPNWAARIPVEVDPEDEDGPIDPLALTVAWQREADLFCHGLVVLADNAAFGRGEHFAVPETYADLRAGLAGERRPGARIGLDANLLLELATALGSSYGHVELELRGPRKAVVVKLIHGTDDREGILMPVRLRRRR